MPAQSPTNPLGSALVRTLLSARRVGRSRWPQQLAIREDGAQLGQAGPDGVASQRHRRGCRAATRGSACGTEQTEASEGWPALDSLTRRIDAARLGVAANQNASATSTFVCVEDAAARRPTEAEASVVTRFWREGHWRTSQSGYTHMGRGDWLDRDAWDWPDWNRDSWEHGWRWTRARLADGVPNAKCPRCSQAVW